MICNNTLSGLKFLNPLTSALALSEHIVRLPVGVLRDIDLSLDPCSLCSTGQIHGVPKQTIPGHALSNYPRNNLPRMDPDGYLSENQLTVQSDNKTYWDLSSITSSCSALTTILFP